LGWLGEHRGTLWGLGSSEGSSSDILQQHRPEALGDAVVVETVQVQAAVPGATSSDSSSTLKLRKTKARTYYDFGVDSVAMNDAPVCLQKGR